MQDELLAEINQWIEDSDKRKKSYRSWLALRAVVELHKPDEKGKYCIYDSPEWEPVEYPCPTILAIAEEL